jgi:hypothetical protein
MPFQDFRFTFGFETILLIHMRSRCAWLAQKNRLRTVFLRTCIERRDNPNGMSQLMMEQDKKDGDQPAFEENSLTFGLHA